MNATLDRHRGLTLPDRIMAAIGADECTSKDLQVRLRLKAKAIPEIIRTCQQLVSLGRLQWRGAAGVYRAANPSPSSSAPTTAPSPQTVGRPVQLPLKRPAKQAAPKLITAITDARILELLSAPNGLTSAELAARLGPQFNSQSVGPRLGKMGQRGLVTREGQRWMPMPGASSAALSDDQDATAGARTPVPAAVLPPSIDVPVMATSRQVAPVVPHVRTERVLSLGAADLIRLLQNAGAVVPRDAVVDIDELGDAGPLIVVRWAV